MAPGLKVQRAELIKEHIKLGDVTVSLTSTIEKQLNRNFVIFHPSDFSPAAKGPLLMH